MTLKSKTSTKKTATTKKRATTHAARKRRRAITKKYKVSKETIAFFKKKDKLTIASIDKFMTKKMTAAAKAQQHVITTLKNYQNNINNIEYYKKVQSAFTTFNEKAESFKVSLGLAIGLAEEIHNDGDDDGDDDDDDY